MNIRTKYALSLLFLAPVAAHANWWDDFFDILGSIDTSHYQSSSYATSGHTAQQHSSTMSERAAKDYIDQMAHSLDYALCPHMKSKYLRTLSSQIRNSILSNRSTYKMTPYGKRYKKDMIDQFINSMVLEFIENRAYNYAYKKCYDSSVARRVAESMRNNALARIMRNNVVNFERVTEFVGSALKRAVRDAINKMDAPYNYNYQPSYASTSWAASTPSYNPHYTTNYTPDYSVYNAPPVQPQPAYNPSYSSEPFYDFDVYPSDDCCCCIESFDDVERVFLKPCGHDICKDCAYQWFFGGNNDSCPHCRATVDLNYLSILVSSAPTL